MKSGQKTCVTEPANPGRCPEMDRTYDKLMTELLLVSQKVGLLQTALRNDAILCFSRS